MHINVKQTASTLFTPHTPTINPFKTPATHLFKFVTSEYLLVTIGYFSFTRFIWHTENQPLRRQPEQVCEYTIHLCLAKVFQDMEYCHRIKMAKSIQIIRQQISLSKCDVRQVSLGSDSL